MYLKATIIVIAIIILAIVGWKALSMRRGLPFQEVIPLDGSIALANIQNWYNDSLKITLRSGSTPVRQKNYNKFGYCVFKGLENGKPYTIGIKRTDLKGMLLYKTLKQQVIPKADTIEYVVLIGASVGKAWNFPQLGSRRNLGRNITLSFREVYDFDKSEALNAVLQAPFPVSGVILKECSAYFPRDIKQSKKQIMDWTNEIRQRKITPVLATVVPITKERDEKDPGKLKSILEFNDFIRKYAAKKHILVLDLEKALRISDSDRHLRKEYAQPDGSHLVKKAYDEALDNIAVELIKHLSNRPNN